MRRPAILLVATAALLAVPWGAASDAFRPGHAPPTVPSTSGSDPRVGSADPSTEPVVIRISTSLGAIVVELDSAAAPGTVANFLRYVDGGFYDGGRFHRVVRDDNQPGTEHRIDVVQGGADPGRRGEGFAPIPLERTSITGLRHLEGTISMARGGPDSARSDFFICVEDEPELDFGGARNPDGQGFAAFGKVVEGMDVVRLIHAAPAEGQSLSPPVPIEGAERLRREPHPDTGMVAKQRRSGLAG